jgi:hypothetical protein
MESKEHARISWAIASDRNEGVSLYNGHMSTSQLRREIKKAVDHVPAERLESLADYVHFLSRAPLEKRLKLAERDIASGKGVKWRQVRSDV